MNRLRIVIAAAAFMSGCVPRVQSQTGCKPQDPAGSFEGSATSQQAGSLDVSLHLECDSGRYAGNLVTPVGTYTVKDGGYEGGKLRLTLAAGSDTVTIEAVFDNGAVRGNFAAADDKG